MRHVVFISCLMWHWLTNFRACVEYHERTCCLYSWSQFDIDLWLQGRIFMLCMFALILAYHIWYTSPSLWDDVSLTFMNPYRTLTFDLKVKFIRFMTWLSVRATYFVLSHNHTMWVYHHGTMCRVHPWTLYDLDLWSQYQIIFSRWIWDLQDCLCSLT